MKLFKLFLIAASIFCTSILLTSCGDKASSKTELQGKEYTSTYVCPMHCEGSGSDETGKCPVCGMDYVENKEHMKDGHSH